MRVHLLVHRFPPRSVGGTERYALSLARSLLASGHQVGVFSYAPGTSDVVAVHEDTYEGVAIRRLSFDLRRTGNPLREEYDNARVARFFADCWRREPPDLVHVLHPGYLSSSPLTAAAELGLPTVVTLTDMWAVCPAGLLLRSDGSLCDGPADVGWCARCVAAMGPRGRRLRVLAHSLPTALWRALAAVGEHPIGREWPGPGWLAALRQRPAVIRERLLAAQALLSPGRFLAQVLERNGYPAGSVRVLPHGIDAPERLHRSTALAATQGLRLGYLGPLAPHKGAHLPVAALGVLDGHVPVTVDYWGARPGPEAHDGYAATVLDQVSAEPRARHRGPFGPHELQGVLEQMDVLVVPSLCYENTPTVIYEACASGTPTIATNEGGMRELVQDLACGWLIPRDDPQALAARIRHLAEHHDEVRHLAAAMRPVPALVDHIVAVEALYAEVTR